MPSTFTALHFRFTPMLAALVLCASVTAFATPAARVAALVEDAARAELVQQAERAALRDPLFELTVVDNGRKVADCPVPVTLENIDTRQPSRMRFAVICSGDNGWRREFVVRASVSARVLVAAADIPAGQPLAADDLALERRTVTTMPDTLSMPQDAIGMSARRTLHAGGIVRKGMLAAPVLVKRGDAVRILASRGGIEVNVAGVALDSGANGAMVRVRNTSSGNIIHARVIAAATVEPAEIPAAISPHSPERAD